MEETNGTTTASSNRMVVILLGVIVVLLLAIVAYFVFANGNADPTPSSTTGTGTGATTTPPAGMGTATATEFDPATATVVAAGVTPEQHVTTYFDAVVAGDYATAFAMLPTSKQAEYGDQSAFADQLTGYGITSYTIDGATEANGEAQVTATAVMPGGSFQYLWTFVQDGENWLVKSRALPGMN